MVALLDNVADLALFDGPVLLVEDNVIVAMDTEEKLRELGATDVRVAYTQGEALEQIQAHDVSAAVLDFNLVNGNTAELADVLTQKGVPFVFASGVANIDALPDRFASHSLLIKPFTDDDIRQAFATLIGVID